MTFEWNAKSIKILTSTYVSFDEPSDKIAGNRQLASTFARLVNKKLEDGTSSEDMVRKLISLRKQGKLPTLRHTKATENPIKS